MVIFHDGKSDFPHGAGPSEPGWYSYPTDDTTLFPNGPYKSKEDAMEAGIYLILEELMEKLHSVMR